MSNGCVTVGWYDDTAGHAWGLIETQSGTGWTETQAPQPSNAGSGTDQELRLGASDCGELLPCRPVSCPSANFCVAVGQYKDTAGYLQPVVETYANGSWTAAPGALPSDTATDSGPTNFPDGFLFSVSCASTTSCAAVGRYTNTSGVSGPYLATLSGTTWSAEPAPLPSGAMGGGLTGVSCPSSGSCTAVGSYEDASSLANGLIEVLANGIWTPMRAPEPSNAGNDTDGDQSADLVQVSCAAVSACVAVGEFEDNAAALHALIVSWNGSTWTGTQGPLPAGVTTPDSVQLLAVSCGSVTTCTAVGTYSENGGTTTWPLIDTLVGGCVDRTVGAPTVQRVAAVQPVGAAQ